METTYQPFDRSFLSQPCPKESEFTRIKTPLTGFTLQTAIHKCTFPIKLTKNVHLPEINGVAFFMFDSKRYDHVFLVTCYHVIKGDGTKIISLPSGGCHPKDLDISNGTVVFPNGNDDLDLCAIKFPCRVDEERNLIIDDLVGRTHTVKLDIDYVLRNDDIASPEHLKHAKVGDEIGLCGCPNGLYDYHNLATVFRFGRMSLDPNMPYNRENTSLVSILSFPGDSGAAVLIDVGGNGRSNSTFASAFGGWMLLGVLDSAFFNDPKRNEGLRAIGISPYIKSDLLSNLEEWTPKIAS